MDDWTVFDSSLSATETRPMPGTLTLNAFETRLLKKNLSPKPVKTSSTPPRIRPIQLKALAQLFWSWFVRLLSVLKLGAIFRPAPSTVRETTPLQAMSPLAQARAVQNNAFFETAL